MKRNRNIYSRVIRLEQQANPKEPPVFLVYLENDEGLLERWDGAGEVVEVLTAEQFEQLPGKKIHVRPGDEAEE